MDVTRLAEWMESHQIALYIGALVLGGLLPFVMPSLGLGLVVWINPVLMLLLYATFLAVPFGQIREAFRDLQFLRSVLVVNFLIAPCLVFLLSRFVANDQAVLVGVLLVLLAPCIDYVVVFTRMAEGDWEKLLATTPVLMLTQMMVLPVFIFLFTGGTVASSITPEPFLGAFIQLIAIPLGLSVLTQHLADRLRIAQWAVGLFEFLMVPLMMATLFVVVASQIAGVSAAFSRVLWAVPVYAAFLIIMPVIGTTIGRITKQNAKRRRALAFTGSTRNSLVVLPLALALPEHLALAGVVVVTQTLVELVGMVTFVSLFPKTITDDH